MSPPGAFPLFPLFHELSQRDYELISIIIFNLLTMGDDDRYRYRLDVDGYGWSSRWQKLLTTNSVVLKSTIYVSPSPITITNYLSWSRISLPLYPFYDLNDIADLDPSLETALKRQAEQPEWWTAQSIPWYHYIPLKYDYTDLWDVLAFLDGAPDATGSLGSSIGEGSLGTSGSSSGEEEEEEEEEEKEEEKRAEEDSRGKEGVAEEIAKRGMELAKENLR